MHNRNYQAGILTEHLDRGVEVADCVTPRREEHRDDVSGGHAEEEQEDEILVVTAGHLKTEVKYSTGMVIEPSSPIDSNLRQRRGPRYLTLRTARQCVTAG